MMGIPETMKAVVVSTTGGLDALTITSHPVPRCGEEQILVRNQYAGLNFIDIYYRSGLYKQPCPFIAGQEGGGTVVAVGSKVKDDIQVGDEVAYIALVGSYCEYTAVPVSKAVKVPSSLGLEKTLSCMNQGLTAHYLVTDATAGLIQEDEWCLIYSVASGTCQWACQMAKLQGYKVIGTTSKNKIDIVPKVCDEVIVLDTVDGKSYSDYESVDIVAKVMEITAGKGVKCIIDGIGKSTFDISLKCLDRRGIWISFGNAGGSVPPFAIQRLVAKSAFCTRPKLSDYIASKSELNARTQQVFQWVESGLLDVKVDKVFSLDEVKDGHAYLEAGQSKGKVLFKI